MNLYLIIAIILANAIAIGIVYQFIKKLSKKEIITFLAVSVAIIYILISIVYEISGLGIEQQIHSAAKEFVIYLFVPVNLIVFVPYIALQYRKWKQNEIPQEKLWKKILLVMVLLLFALILEYFYFCKIQKNITNLSEEKELKYQNEQFEQNEIQTEEILQNTVEGNEEFFSNTILNEI